MAMDAGLAFSTAEGQNLLAQRAMTELQQRPSNQMLVDRENPSIALQLVYIPELKQYVGIDPTNGQARVLSRSFLRNGKDRIMVKQGSAFRYPGEHRAIPGKLQKAVALGGRTVLPISVSRDRSKLGVVPQDRFLQGELNSAELIDADPTNPYMEALQQALMEKELGGVDLGEFGAKVSPKWEDQKALPGFEQAIGPEWDKGQAELEKIRNLLRVRNLPKGNP
jgi:hypothetical protein